MHFIIAYFPSMAWVKPFKVALNISITSAVSIGTKMIEMKGFLHFPHIMAGSRGNADPLISPNIRFQSLYSTNPGAIDVLGASDSKM